jgi:mannose-6-phosphate isomerase class I
MKKLSLTFRAMDYFEQNVKEIKNREEKIQELEEKIEEQRKHVKKSDLGKGTQRSQKTLRLLKQFKDEKKELEANMPKLIYITEALHAFINTNSIHSIL